MDDQSLTPLQQTPMILGVIFDPMFTFSHHINSIHSRASNRLNVLKALAGSSWGHNKETILLTYNSIIKPILTYAAPIWSPSASTTGISKLQLIQNSALRIATGSTQMASLQHIHSETLTLPLQQQLKLLCSQFLASAMRVEHPSHPIVISHPGPRQMKHTLSSTHLHTVAPYLNTDGNTSPDTYTATLKFIHSDIVQDTITTLATSNVLGIIPPDICTSECTLPRVYRTTLSQLRSGYCSRLRSYLHRIGSSDDPTCPECMQEPHTTHHLFSCQAYPNSLQVADLWHRPCEVAALISGMTAFRDLPPLDGPPHNIPPEHPPEN